VTNPCNGTAPESDGPAGTRANVGLPSVVYGDLYAAVELGRIFPDGKTFSDMVPHSDPQAIMREYHIARTMPDFDLPAFIRRHFSDPTPPGPMVGPSAPGESLLAYVRRLWSELLQNQASAVAFSTLLPLPHPYVVPGGRFREMYYWDSYFTMLGLVGDGHLEMARDMLMNFAFEIDHYGHIPTGNRSYYLGRSQPPFFSLMVDLIAEQDGARTYLRYLPELRKEWEFWMNGAEEAGPGAASRHVVRLADGTWLNRYFDPRATPRDESYKEDVETASSANRPAGEVWQNIRAATESGWDFSSRWFGDGKTMATIRTLSMAPVDLNSLLVHLEQTLAEAYRLDGDAGNAALFDGRAQQRAASIRRLMWDTRVSTFTDYLWDQDRTTGSVTAAALFPLFLDIATAEQAKAVAATVRRDLLMAGGLATTRVVSGEQWDAPNGWAPLQWIAVRGLRNYGEAALAREISTRWVRNNMAFFRRFGKLVEKYDVTTDGGDVAGGGEYTTQIGFGWTNAVLLAISNLYPELRSEVEAVTQDPA
jgi:alpha,alpha-trehalase